MSARAAARRRWLWLATLALLALLVWAIGHSAAVRERPEIGVGGPTVRTGPAAHATTAARPQGPARIANGAPPVVAASPTAVPTSTAVTVDQPARAASRTP
jgi:hypothetical protein